MPLFSCFTPFGLFEFSSDASLAEKLYRSILASYRDPRTGEVTIDTTPGTHQEAKIYSWALAIADAMMHTNQAGRELRPETSYYLLQAHEAKFQVVPGPNDSVTDRRNELLARQQEQNGPRFEAMVDLLRTVLGSDFIAYCPVDIDDALPYPTNGGAIGVYADPSIPAKVIRLTSAAARVGYEMQVGYENWDVYHEEVQLVPNDVVLLSPDLWGVAEKVVVTKASGTGTSRVFSAVFTKPHQTGTFGTTGTFPMWISTKRHVFIVVSPSAAVDATTRTKIETHLRRVMRAPTTWSIVQPSSVVSPTVNLIGPFQLGVSPLGSVPVEQISAQIVPLPPVTP